MLLPDCASAVSLSMKNTRCPPDDSMKRPGATRSMSLRPWKRSRNSRIWWLDHGQTKIASTAMASSTGAAKRSTGRRKLIRLWPHENHTTISLLAYMRVSVAVIATNRLSVRMVGRWPSTV